MGTVQVSAASTNAQKQAPEPVWQGPSIHLMLLLFIPLPFLHQKSNLTAVTLATADAVTSVGGTLSKTPRAISCYCDSGFKVHSGYS